MRGQLLDDFRVKVQCFRGRQSPYVLAESRVAMSTDLGSLAKAVVNVFAKHGRSFASQMALQITVECFVKLPGGFRSRSLFEKGFDIATR